VLTGDSYQQLRFNFDELATFVAMRMRYEAAEADRGAFISALHRIRDLLLPRLSPVFDDLVTSGSPGIIHLQDVLNAVPMTMLAAEHEGLCRAMEAGEFEVHVVPALHASLGEEPLKRPHICAIRDDKDHLLLAHYEAQTASSLMEASSLAVFTPGDTGDLLDDLTEAKLLIVSTHGSAISRYTDPIFGSLSGELGSHIISGDRIQTAFPWLPYRLAVLNACHAGSGLARNFQHQFRTHDVAGFPALLLLNRRSVVGAAAWRTPDMASYIHLALTAIGLAEGLIPSRALSRATAKLRSLSKAETLDLLDLVPDPVVRATAVQMIAAEPPAGMFNKPYFYGAFETYSLF
jgi:CHAT domain-containing protein